MARITKTEIPTKLPSPGRIEGANACKRCDGYGLRALHPGENYDENGRPYAEDQLFRFCEHCDGTGRIPKREEEMMNDYEKLCARAFTSSLNYVRKSGGAALSEEHGHAIVMSLAREMRSWCNNNGGLALGPVMDAIIAQGEGGSREDCERSWCGS